MQRSYATQQMGIASWFTYGLKQGYLNPLLKGKRPHETELTTDWRGHDNSYIGSEELYRRFCDLAKLALADGLVNSEAGALLDRCQDGLRIKSPLVQAIRTYAVQGIPRKT